MTEKKNANSTLTKRNKSAGDNSQESNDESTSSTEDIPFSETPPGTLAPSEDEPPVSSPTKTNPVDEVQQTVAADATSTPSEPVRVRSRKRNVSKKTSRASAPSPSLKKTGESHPPSQPSSQNDALLKKLAMYLNQIADGDLDTTPDIPTDSPAAKEVSVAIHRIVSNAKELRKGFEEVASGNLNFVQDMVKSRNGLEKNSPRDNYTPAFISMVKAIESRAQDASEQFNNNFARIFEINQSLAEMIHKVAKSASETEMQAMAIDKKTSDVNEVSHHLTNEILTIRESAASSQNNIASVSTASEEMTATVSEIAENAEQARSIASDAVNAVNDASSEVSQLENAAIQISNVIETIVEIAEQTKLLALNATIEAARAGEAGKGFAVVAGEVKELAQQTNSATADIRNKIEAIQMATKHTISKIRNISEVMKEVDDFVSTIATATEEQTITTREITENLTMSSGNISNVTSAVGELLKFAENMAHTIQNVTEDTTLIKKTSSNLSGIASELERTETVLIQALSDMN